MESAACLEIVIEAFEKRHVIVWKLCCDDDSLVRADCQWNNADWMINNNRLDDQQQQHGGSYGTQEGWKEHGQTEKAQGQWQTTGAYT
jgi:hypothetical protein